MILLEGWKKILKSNISFNTAVAIWYIVDCLRPSAIFEAENNRELRENLTRYNGRSWSRRLSRRKCQTIRCLAVKTNKNWDQEKRILFKFFIAALFIFAGPLSDVLREIEFARQTFGRDRLVTNVSAWKAASFDSPANWHCQIKR